MDEEEMIEEEAMNIQGRQGYLMDWRRSSHTIHFKCTILQSPSRKVAEIKAAHQTQRRIQQIVDCI